MGEDSGDRFEPLIALPGATPVGSETMSAVGGGGSVRCIATTWPLAEVVTAISRTFGVPQEASPTAASWHHTTETERGRLTTFADAWTVGHGSAPGFDPSLLPPDALSVVAIGSAATSGAPTQTRRPRRRRWPWRRLRPRTSRDVGFEVEVAHPMGRDRRGADLRGAVLVGADLRDADLRGADLAGADLSGALLHGADLRETRFGKSGLGHRGGDPELTAIYDPEIFGARADDRTRWPEGFEVFGNGVVYEGPDVLTIDGDVVIPPQHRRSPEDGHGRFRNAQGWLATIDADGGPVSVPGTRLLECNLHLIVGQPALTSASADVGRETTWRVVDHDDEAGTLSLRRQDEVAVLPATKVLELNVARWWWHVPGSDWVAQS